MFWGLGLQFCMGIFVIRTQPGLIAFEWLGKQVQVLHLYIFLILNNSITLQQIVMHMCDLNILNNILDTQ